MDRTAAERMRRMRARRRESAPEVDRAGSITPQRSVRTDHPSGHRNRAAVERTISALRRDGRLDDDIDAALTAIARTTADALDGAQGLNEVSVVARVHLVALRALLAGPEAEDNELDEFLARLREVS